MESTWIEAATRWLATYAMHSAVLALIGLTVALACFRPGARRATVLKIALIGGFFSASLPWKAFQPLDLLPGSLSVEAAPMPMEPDRTASTDGPAAEGTLPSDTPRLASLSTAAATAPAKRPLSPFAAMVTVLAALSLIGTLRLLYGRRRFIRGLRRTPLNDSASRELLSKWARTEARPAVALTASARLRCPVVLSSNEICVPEQLWSALSTDEREAALAHEYAHIERRDPIWFLGTAALSRALFFLPWHGALRRRWVASAEFACDRRAATRVGSETQVARCLSSVAEWSVSSTGQGVPSSMAAMAATPGELVRRVKHVLETEDRPSTGRFRLACVAALAAFACGSPRLDSQMGEDQDTSVVEILISPGRMITLQRPGAEPEHPPLTIHYQGREAKGEVTEWLRSAVADFPMFEWPGTTTIARSGTGLIRAEADAPFRDVQHIMSQFGDRDIQIPDLRLATGGVSYRIPLPVDLGVSARDAGEGPEGVCAEFRIDRIDDDTPSVRFAVTTKEAAKPGTLLLPLEEEEGGADDFFIGRSAEPRQLATLNSVESWIDERPETSRVLQARIDPRKGVTVKDVAALLDVLHDRGVTDITFMGSYEQ